MTNVSVRPVAARRARLVARSLMLAAALAAPAASAAQEAGSAPAESSSTLKKLSIEDLMDIDVTSASRRPEKLSTAAAAITVVTAEDIRRSGAVTLPDALRLVPGLQVAQADGQTWAISARGFNGRSADKLLVLIDGRTVYSPLFSGVFWDSQDVLLADVERIEVIRGPQAALWGANAVNGVINIITKKAGDTQGGRLEAGAGVNEPGFGSLRYGSRAGDLAWRVYGNYIYTPPMVSSTGLSEGDPLRRGQGGFRSDWTPATGDDSATFQGDIYKGLTGLGGGNLLGRWGHRFAPDSDLTLQTYADFTRRDDPFVYEEHRRTFDLDLQHHYTGWEDQNLVWGLGYRRTSDSLVDSTLINWVPNRLTLEQASTFAQDEISFPSERLRLTLGSRFEYNTFDHFEPEPNVRLAWLPDNRQTFWGAVSRAARTPTRLDEDVRILAGPVVLISGNPDFRSEVVTAYELGYRAQPHPRFSYDIATFYNVYDRLRTTEPALDGGLPYLVSNKLKGSTYGGELALNFQLASFWRWSGSYSYLAEQLRLEADSHDPAGVTSAGDDPKYQTFLRSSLDLPRHTELDATLRRVDSLPVPFVPAYTELDLRLGWRPLGRLELALVGRNLLHAHHPEFGPDDPTREEVQRTCYTKVTWHF
jgi:iron complex outermembrane receptor protein